MPNPKCSDQDFITIWNKHKSCTRVAVEIGTDPENVRARRRRLEKKYDISLPVLDPTRPSYNAAILDHGSPVEKLIIKNGTVIVGGDAHYWPNRITVMHRAYIELCKRLKPVAVVMNGDAFDGAKISRWPSIGWESKPDVVDELNAVQERLDEIEKAAGKACKKLWTAGNHDLRFETRLAAVASEYKGIPGIHLKDHFPKWTPCWLVDINDTQVVIRHRENGGVHASYNNTLKSGTTIVTGHDHRADIVPYDDYKGRRYGVRHGMMAESPRDPQFLNYLEGKAANWQPALAVLTFRNGELLPPELCLKWKGKQVVFRGEVFEI